MTRVTRATPFTSGSSHSVSARLGVPYYRYLAADAGNGWPLIQSHTVSVVMSLIEDTHRATIYHEYGLDARGGDSRIWLYRSGSSLKDGRHLLSVLIHARISPRHWS